VLFLPDSAQSPFVELKGTGGRTATVGLMLRNQGGDTFTLPEGTAAVAEGDFLLIVFDGGNQVEDRTVHAVASNFLDSESGSLELLSADGALLDRVAWGPDQAGAVSMSKGGSVDELVAGTTIGRHPGSLALDLTQWTIFSTTQTTPGAANVQPGVEVMLPVSGAILGQTSLEVTWYPAPGAASYQVQISSDEDSGTLVVDQSTTTPELLVDLQPGTYFWRVQALGPDGAEAQVSPTQSLTIDTGVSSTMHLASLLPQDSANLAVPMIMQHKDTGMLLLESKRETGAHAWDVAHPGLDRSDPADAHNCVLASVAMINNFLGGDLSQDRIGYEIFKDFWSGPEFDLNYGEGLYAFQQEEALTFALDAAPSFHPTGETPDLMWEEITYEIDQGRPVFATIPGHAFVVTGYRIHGERRIVAINDPWWGSYEADVDVVAWEKHFLISPASLPVFQEPEITMHSDSDGIVDFDETQRFATSPTDDDFDKDDLKDKDDVRASVFDEHFGYAVTGILLGRDFDEDGLLMERDVDADDGGCFDGMEDYDYNGKHNQPETWNFDDGDDACLWGTDELVLDENRINDYGGNHHQRIRTFVTFSARPVEGGKLEGLAQIEYTWTGEFNSDVCSGTHAVDPGYYQAALEGEFYQQPGSEGTFFSLRANPDHGEPYAIQWNTACPAAPTPMQGWTWGGQGGTLEDGVYDYYVDMAAAGMVTNGEFWQKVHVEQGGIP
jgi:hypothetical protein